MPDMGRHLPSPRTALALLTGLNLLNYLDRFIPGAVLPSISRDLHLSDTQAGSLQMAFILTFAVTSPVFGWLGDRRARFELAAIGVIVWSAATVGSGLAVSFATLALARALTGVGEASYTVVTPSLLSDFYPANRRGRALAFFYAAIPAGTAAGYVVGGQVAAHFGWRTAFFIAGAPGMVLALTLYALRDPVRGAQDRTAASKVAVTAREAIRAFRARPSFFYNTAAQTIYTFTTGGLAFWMPTYYVRVRHIDAADATLIFGLLLLSAGFAGTLIGGLVGDRLARTRPDAHFLLSAVGLVASGPFTLVAIMHPSPAIFWPSMFVTLLLLFINMGPLNAAMANVLPAALRGRGVAVNTFSIHVFGDAFSPLVVGAMSDRIGLQVPVLATGLLLVVAGLVLLAGRPSLRRDLAAAAVTS
jgi:MFS transporter, Spinster family, sphingosine-1-phosphate transporter